jgi:hypothetical protein
MNLGILKVMLFIVFEADYFLITNNNCVNEEIIKQPIWKYKNDFIFTNLNRFN